MTVTFSARRSDQPLQIGSRHGYRIEGDQAAINAEISVPPYHPGGSWALELWASERPYQGGELSGVLVSELQFELPTPLAPHTHRIEVNVPARLPQQGRAYFMLLALVERGGERRVRDVASYPALESFPAPQLQGDVGYEIRGHEVLLQAAVVSNPRAPGNLSGTLALELWGWPEGVPAALELGQGVCLGAAQLEPVAGGEARSALVCRGAFSEPPPGNYQLSLLLREWTHAVGYLTRDRRDFAQSYYVAAPAAALEAALPEVVALDADVSEPEASEAEISEAEISEPVALEAGVSEAEVSEAEVSQAEVPELAPTSVAPPRAQLEAASWEEVLPEAASWEEALQAVSERTVAAEAVAEPVTAAEAVAAPVAAAEVVAELVVAAEAVAASVVAAEAVAEPVVAAEAVAEPVVAEEAVAPKAEPVAVQAALSAAESAPPVSVTRASRAVSINAGSVEELARVKGLNTKVAKEILKRRPYASVEELVEVRGIGRKMLDKIRPLVTL